MAEKATKGTPPYLPYKTLANTLAGWATALPARIDRTLFRSYSGATQSWLISTLRYFALIDGQGHPTPRLQRLVTATGTDRQKVFAEIVKHGYPFVFANGLDLSKATSGQIQDRFRDTGLQGDTVRKAMALFMAMAKEGGLSLSPFMKMPRQRQSNGGPRQKRVAKPTSKPSAQTVKTINTTTGTTTTQMLIDILDVDAMDDAEQQAVWTLVRYLKKRGS